MNDFDLDMSPGTELFPEANDQYNSYGSNDQLATDPLSGVTPDVADQGISDKEMNFAAIRQELSKFQRENEYLRGQVDAFQRQPIRDPEPAKPAYDPLKDVDDEDWAKGSALKDAYRSLKEDYRNLEAKIEDRIAAMSTKSQYPDWNNVVTQHTSQLTNQNPIYAEMIRNSSNPYEAAYLLGQLNSKAATQPEMSSNAARALHNASKPQPVHTVGGQGQLSKADYYANMSDEDFHKIAARNLADI